MLGTNAIKQYFATGDSHYILPNVSIEWNYNLFYAPYATVNGTGTRTTVSGSWSVNPTTAALGRNGSVYLPDSSSSTRTCSVFNTTNGKGSSTLTISSISSTTNTYKVIFYAKVNGDATVNLSALAYVDYHRAHSTSKQIDSVGWTKFEVYISSRPIDTAYSSPKLTLSFESVDGIQSYGVLIDQLEIYQTTDFEYQYGNIWPTSAPFNAFRPGESYVPSGNRLTQLPTDFRKIKMDFQSAGTNWNNQYMPVSPVVFHPTLLATNNSNPVYKNGSLSEWTQYKYFVTDKNTQSISAIYDNILNTNKIVLKFNLSYSKPSAFTVSISGSTNTYSGGYTTTYTEKVVTLSSTDIDNSGTCIIYLQEDGSWKSAAQSGTWDGANGKTPSFDFSGNVKFGGSTGGTASAIAAINKITVTQTSASVSSYYSSKTNVNENLNGGTTLVDQSSEMKRMQIVEVSPRLEIDVTYYTMNVSTHEELDNKQNPLPISAISSNMANITLSNVPITVSNQVLSLFSNNSSNSILKGLFRNYVKCYINYVIKDNVSGTTAAERVVPGGVFYVDTWDVRDIQKTSITAYDISKYLQLLQPTDYVTQSEDVFRTISNILDFAGFTDYNYDELKKVTKSAVKMVDGTIKSNSSPLKIRYFYCDGQTQKVFDVLREIFEVYQIAAYIDSYGVMRFISLDDVFDKTKKIDMLLHDNKNNQSITVSGGYTNDLTITSNIVQDTYTETTKTKVGKATIVYKTPQITKTIAADPRLLNNNLYVDYSANYIDSTNAIWDVTIDESTTYNHLAQSMSLSDTKFRVPDNEATAATGEVNFNTYSIDHDGYGIVEGEIISFKNKEFIFKGSNINETRSIANSSEFAATWAELLAKSGQNSNLSVNKTGFITGVDRGLFNTPVREHTVMTKANMTDKLDMTAAQEYNVSAKGNILLYSINNRSVVTCKDPYSTGSSRNTYNTFSTKILLGKNSGETYPTPSAMGLILHDTNQAQSVLVYISKNLDAKGNNKYQLYAVGANDATPLLAPSSWGKDITSIINNEAKKYPAKSPFEEYGQYVNLKFVKGSAGTNSFEIYINKTNVKIQTMPDLTLDTSGKFGVFFYCVDSGKSGSCEFREIYATQTAIHNPDVYYHYQLPWFAEKIASNKKIFEINYMVQPRPVIVGINYYDIKDAQGPSMDAYPLKLKYDWYYVVDGDTPSADEKIKRPYIRVDENALSYSPIYHSGFRSRFAIVNCSPSQVWIRKKPDSINTIDIDFSLITNTLITLGPDVTIEKVFDEANINESVDITSNWVQDKATAQAILKNVYRALDGFTRDTSVSIYGNPLYEIGDIVKVNYDLKNITNQKYFVQGIQQTFDTGLTTVLTLNQIG